MQKDLLKLALTGLAAGVCISAQGGGSEIAMAKCSRTPTSQPAANEDQNQMNGQMQNKANEQMMQEQAPQESKEMNQGTNEEMDQVSSCNSQHGSCSSCHSQSSGSESSCAGSCGSQADQGDQSSFNEPIAPEQNFLETKRLSAAKIAMGGERMPDMDN